MTEAPNSAWQSSQAIAEFNAQNNSNGLFLRYARGRIAHAWSRIGLASAGAFTFGFLGDLRSGLLVALLILSGEIIEYAVLRTHLKQWSFTQPAPHGTRLAATLSAVLQSITVAAAVSIVWICNAPSDTHFFATAFLMAAALDAGATLRFYQPAAVARLAIYSVAFAGLEIWEVLQKPEPAVSMNNGLDVAASLVLALVTGLVIRFLSRTHDRRASDARRILEEQERLMASQAALEAKEREAERLALVARHANDGVVIYRADGRIDWVNETFRRITGFSPSDLVGQRMEDIIPAEDLDPAAVAELVVARREMRPCRTELKTRRQDGDIIWIDVNLTPIPGGDGMPPLMIAVEREITEAKRREEELARARAEAEEAALAKSRFLATMSHELRTPMNGVIGTAELLATTDLDADQKLYTQTIVESGQALLTIINDVLDLSRLQSGSPILSRVPFDLSACVTRAVELMRPAARAKEISLDLQTGANSAVVVGDEGRVRQIVLNLVGNAIKFTETGGISISLLIREEGAKASILIAVSDSGIGIPEERLDAVFESFTQADHDVGRKFGGTGLGLTISRRLAREMGGDITVASTPGHGSTFTLALALDMASDGVESPVENDTKLLAGTSPDIDGIFAGISILLVEDNRTNALIVERMLAPTRADVTLARNGEDALEIYPRLCPDIVLLDLSMPGKNGFEVLAEIRATDPEIGYRVPIIALTANAFTEDRDACVAAGFDGFLSKPASRNELVSEILRHIAGTRAAAGRQCIAL